MNPHFSFVHIGLPKTGSTWLQKSFFPGHSEIQVIGMASRTSRLRPLNAAARLLYSDSFSVREFNALLARYSSLILPQKILGMSDENLSGYPTTVRNIDATASNIKQALGDVKIFVVLRDPVQYLNSAYIQSIRSGQTTTCLQSFFADTSIRRGFVERLDYKRLLDIYRDKFSEVLVLPFELLVREPDEYLAAICKFIGVEKAVYTSTSRNSAIPELIQRMMRLTNVIDMKLWPGKRPIARFFWPRIYQLPLPFKKSEKVGLEFFRQYDEFRILAPENYDIWSGAVSKYNYFRAAN